VAVVGSLRNHAAIPKSVWMNLTLPDYFTFGEPPDLSSRIRCIAS
jgi:hypothetical protein